MILSLPDSRCAVLATRRLRGTLAYLRTRSRVKSAGCRISQAVADGRSDH